ncbi:hypothetical protein I0C86_04525 [Plantactinospora sp. S1510]|uniref:Uncharacterized protein n=1 Tax=Plantactinospora alkalitolerans TaxID=2789879 RepID=A0ABS0GPZ9_9ACTN|nr:hypothetical protein [Plantactinospora alkalitolerans]MBF9128263.1 hypothetical protein [Plantactinospora alkalitolerans]
MAVRGWGGSVATAIGVAAGAGAAQLGLGYGLGIIAWMPSAGGTSEAAWLAGLTWAAWIAATSTIAGAICAHRLGGAGRPRRSTVAVGPATEAPPSMAGGMWRVVLAVSSAVGALVTVVLVAVPARAVVRPDTGSPQTVAAGYAVLGVLIGLLVAIWATSSPAVATNVLGTVGWLWALAVIAVIDGVLSGRGLASAQLGVWQLTSDSGPFWFRDYFYWPGAALSLGSALLIGAFAARAAARRPAARVGAAVSGISGPLLVAIAYFLAAPRLVGIRPEQVSAHLMAPYAVVAGLAGSALVAALAQRSEARAQDAEPRVSRSDPAEPGVEAAATEAEAGSETAGGVTDGSGRPPRLPVQPTGGSWRTADDADPFPPRRADGPTDLSGSDEPDPLGRAEDRPDPLGRTSDEVGSGGGAGGERADEPSEGSTDETSPTNEKADEKADDGRAKGRLGRFGRRSR